MIAAALVLLAAIDPWALHPAAPKDCDAIVAAHPKEYAAWFCYMRAAFREPARVSKARTLRHLRQRLARDPHEGYARLLAGLLTKDEDDAGALYAAAALDLERAGALEGEVYARASLAGIACAQGRFKEADGQVVRAAETARRSGDPDLPPEADDAAARCALASGDYGRALALFGRMRARVEAAPPSWRTNWLRGNALNGLGRTYALLGRHREALEIDREELEDRRGNYFVHACAQHRIAEEMARLAQEGELPWEEADHQIELALDEEVRASCRAYVNGGEIYTRLLHAERLGPTPEGAAEARRAVALTRHEPGGVAVCKPLRMLARLLAAQDPKGALRAASEAVALARTYASRLDLAEGLLTRAQLRQGREAERDALAALDQFDQLRALQPDDMVRARSASEWSGAYHYVAQMFAQKSPSRALAIVERLGARSLLDLVAARDRPRTALEERKQRGEVLAAIARTERRLLEPGGAARAQDLAELRRLEARELELRDAIARAAPPPEGAVPPPLERLQAALGERQAMLLFQIPGHEGGESPWLHARPWVLVVTRERAASLELAGLDALGAEVSLMAGLVARRDGSEAQGAASLHRRLLAPALAWLGQDIDRLIVVPDGPLHRLAFDALRDAAGQAVAERYALTVAPSAALWLRLRQGGAAGSRAAAPVLALGDPAGARPLPFARAEAQSVVRALGHGSELRVGEGASEHFLKTAQLGRYAVLHLATHARVDEVRPERSAIELAPGAQDEDGLLQMDEVADLDLGGRLVSLASCGSSAGEVLPGEGVMSLARGFFQAGARTVVAAPWAVRDDDAASLFGAFYERLAQGLSVSDAMAQARRALIARGTPAATWAGLVVFGDGDAAPLAALASISSLR